VRFHFEVIVRLKEGLLDPQGKAIEDSLPHMGWTNVSDVRVGKHIALTIDADSASEAGRQAEEIAGKLLANPVIEDVRVDQVRNVASEPLGRGVAG
jgi:phosphoribosylformylglycinamidine synthase subunit PurS